MTRLISGALVLLMLLAPGLAQSQSQTQKTSSVDGAHVTQGAKADAAVTDATTTNSLMSFLKGLVKIFADVWDDPNNRLNVAIQNTPAVTVSGTVNNQYSNITVDADTGAGTQTLTLFGVALPASGGSVIGGTSTNPFNVVFPSAQAVTQSGTWGVRAQDGSGNAITSATRGSERALTVQIVDNSGNQVTSFGGSGGTASNFGSAFPTPGTAAGFSDGTNMQAARLFDGDSGAGTQYVLGMSLRKIASGGTVEAGTSSDPFRIDPTGTTTQPVSGTVTANAGTNLNTSSLLTTTAHDAAFGTAGTADTQVRTIQGIAGMTAVTVDSELPAAVQSTTTGQTAPTAPFVNAFIHCQDSGATTVSPCIASANVAHDAVATSANPLLIGGYASAAAPTDVSADGDAVRAWLLRNGARVTALSAAGALIGGDATNGLDVDVTRVPSDPFGANADAGSASGSISAKLRFIASTGIPITGTVTVGSHAVTNAGTFVVQENGAALTALQLIDNLPNTLGSTTSGQSGALGLGAVTTSAPSYTNAQSNALSLQTDGSLRTAITNTLTVLPGNTPNSSPWLVSLVPPTSGGSTPCYITSGASTNATNCKASAGQLYSVEAVNTTATLYYLRLYNLSSSPTCSSATGFVRTIPVPPYAAAGGAGGIVIDKTVGEAYGTGLGFCLTGGGSSTDNTNAATGVYVTLNYK